MSFKAFYVLLVLSLFAVIAQAEEGEKNIAFLEEETVLSDTGYFTVEWANPSSELVQVELSSSTAQSVSRLLYRGNGRKVFLSGLRDGTYDFELKDHQSLPLDSLTLEVHHHSLSKSLLLFLVGAVVFSLVLVVILRGER